MSFSVNSVASTAALYPSRPSSGRVADGQETKPYIAALSASDKELVFQATGQRVGEHSDIVPLFAVEIGLDRMSGRLPQGGEITPSYLRDMASKYESSENTASFGAAISNALKYLTTQAAKSGLDVLS